MKIRRNLTLAVSVAATLVTVGASTADAQCASTYDGTIRWGIDNAGADVAGACGVGASVDVWARVLSGSSWGVQKLWFLGVDGAASTLTNITAGPAGGGFTGVNILLNKPQGCDPEVDDPDPGSCTWDGTPYAPTLLGNFATGTKLVFGLSGYVGWKVSSNSFVGANPKFGYQNGLYDFGNQTDAGGAPLFPNAGIWDDTRNYKMPPSIMSGRIYGWDDGGSGPCGPDDPGIPGPDKLRYKGALSGCNLAGTQSIGADRDYQDLIFELRTDVVPEPASVALLATGLIGVGGAAVARRRRSSK